MQAALHNLAQHEGSPPSSTSCHSAASSSLTAPSCSAAVTSITANDCFDGSALIDSTASTALDAAARHAADAAGSQQPTDSTQAQGRPSNQRCEGRQVFSSTEAPDQATSSHVLDQSCCSSSGSPQGLQPQQLWRRQQQPGWEPSQDMRRQAQQPSGTIQSRDASHMLQQPASQPTSARQAKLRSARVAATKHSQDSESSEELMTLEELEGRIASLNKTLLRAPTGLQASLSSRLPADPATLKEQRPSHQHAGHAALGQQHPLPQRQHQDLSPLASVQADRTQLSRSRGVRSSKLDDRAHQSSSKGRISKPPQTAWQKLTAQHQMLQGSASGSQQHADEEAEAINSPAHSPPEPSVSEQGHKRLQHSKTPEGKPDGFTLLCKSRQQDLQRTVPCIECLTAQSYLGSVLDIDHVTVHCMLSQLLACL